jgi:hypothetical protein
MLRHPENIEVIPAKTWASVVPPNILSATFPIDRKRQEAIYELMATEKSYVQDLQLIFDIFYTPLQSMLSSTDLHSIFLNLKDILQVNAKILSDFEKLQSQSNWCIQSIGNTFLNHVY